MRYKQLKKFKNEELILGEAETITVLKFIFEKSDHTFIDSLQVNDKIRGFAQGLLVEAIDASYKIGFVEAVFRSTTNPTKNAIQVLKKFGRKAASHWFRHAKASDLQTVCIYEFVRQRIAVNFKSVLGTIYIADNTDKNYGAFISYKKPATKTFHMVWG